MKPGKGKAKGSAFERIIAKQLSRWLTDGKDATQLVRSVLSGGWGPRAARQAGDLAANGPEGERFRATFVVECKHRRGDLLWGLYTKTGTECIQGWWQKLEQEARSVQCVPLLIFRQNGRPTMLATYETLADRIFQDFVHTGKPRPPFLTHRSEPKRGAPTVRFVILPLDAFLRLSPKTIYQILGESL